jgi:hypothetical protein
MTPTLRLRIAILAVCVAIGVWATLLVGMVACRPRSQYSLAKAAVHQLRVGMRSAEALDVLALRFDVARTSNREAVLFTHLDLSSTCRCFPAMVDRVRLRFQNDKVTEVLVNDEASWPVLDSWLFRHLPSGIERGAAHH